MSRSPSRTTGRTSAQRGRAPTDRTPLAAIRVACPRRVKAIGRATSWARQASSATPSPAAVRAGAFRLRARATKEGTRSARVQSASTTAKPSEARRCSTWTANAVEALLLARELHTQAAHASASPERSNDEKRHATCMPFAQTTPRGRDPSIAVPRPWSFEGRSSSMTPHSSGGAPHLAVAALGSTREQGGSGPAKPHDSRSRPARWNRVAICSSALGQRHFLSGLVS